MFGFWGLVCGFWGLGYGIGVFRVWLLGFRVSGFGL